MLEYLKKYNIQQSRINKQIKVYLQSSDILIHSKNIIIDHNKMLYGTSNIYDRSFTKGYDIELSIYLKGDKVKLIEDKIMKQYFTKKTNIQSIKVDRYILENSYTKVYITIIIIIFNLLLFI